MSPERWHAIDSAYEAVREKPAAERERLLALHCGEDRALRREVEALLAAERRLAGEAGFLAAPIDPRQVAGRGQPAQVGEEIAGYRLAAVLGRGGGGMVYRAADRGGREVALKVGWASLSRSEKQRFRREQEILARLAHRGITRLYGVGSTAEGRPFLAMELLDGEPLDRGCDRRRLGLGGRLKLFGQLCSAVHHVHGRGIVHRDLKPGNVMLTRDGRVKLLDFGIAKALDSGTFESRIDPSGSQVHLLTPGYGSPEQVRGGRIGPSSDVFSLAVMLFELLTGIKPYRFEGTSPELLDILQAFCDRPPLALSEALDRIAESPAKARETGLARGAPSLAEWRRQLPPRLEKLLARALAAAPADRPPSAAALAEELRASVAGGFWSRLAG